MLYYATYHYSVLVQYNVYTILLHATGLFHATLHVPHYVKVHYTTIFYIALHSTALPRLPLLLEHLVQLWDSPRVEAQCVIVIFQVTTVVEHIGRPAVLVGQVKLVLLLIVKRVKGNAHQVDTTVRLVERQLAEPLQRLPDGPDAVHIGVVQEEHGVEG